MALTIREIMVRLTGDPSGASKAIDNVLDKAEEIGSKMQRIGGTLTKTLTAPLVAISGFALKSAADIEQTRVAFETLTGSAENAEAILSDLQRFAAGTPFRFQGLADATRLLITMGIEAEAAVPTVEVLADAVAAAGGTTEDLAGVARAIGQIQAKGKASAEELMQLAERGIPAMEILSDKLGLTGEEVANIGKQGISSAAAINALLEGIDEKFGGAAADQAKTLAGLFSTLRDNVELALQDIGEALVENLNLKETLAGAIEFVQRLREGFVRLTEENPKLVKIGIAVAGLAAAIGPLLVGLGGLVSILPAIVSGLGALSAVFAPIPAAVAAVAAAAFLLITNWDKVVAWFDSNLPQVSSVVRAVFDNVKWQIAQIREAITQFIENASAVWRVYGSDIIQIVTATWDQILNVINTAVGLIRGWIDVVIGVLTFDFDQALGGMRRIAETILNSIARTFRNWADQILGFISPVADFFGGDFKRKIDAAKESMSESPGDPAWVEQYAAAFREAAKETEESKDAAEDAGDAQIDLGSLISDTTKAQKQQTKATKESEKELTDYEKTLQKVSDVVETMESALSRATAEVQAFGSTDNLLQTMLDSSREALVSLVEMGRGGSEAAESLRKKIREIEEALGFVRVEARDTGESLQDALDAELARDVTEGVDRLAVSLGDKFKDFASGVGSNILGALEGAFQSGNLSGFLDDLTGDLGGTLKSIFAASGPWGQALAIGLDVAEQFGLDLNALLSDALKALGFGGGPTLGERIREDMSAAFAAINREAEVLADLGQEFNVAEAQLEALRQKILELVSDGISPNNEAVQALIRQYQRLSQEQEGQAGREAFADLIEELRDAGLEIEDGFAEMIKALDQADRLDELRSEYENVANRIASIRDQLRQGGLSESERNELENELQELIIQRGLIEEEMANISDAFGNLTEEQLANASGALDSLASKFAEIAAKEEILGDEFDATGARISALEQTLIALRANGMEATNPIIIALMEQLEALREQAGETAEGIGDAIEEIEFGGGGPSTDTIGDGPTVEVDTDFTGPVERAMNELNRLFNEIDQQAEFMAAIGEDYNVHAERAAALRETIQTLMQAEGDYSEEIEELIDRYKEAQEAAEEYRNSIGRFQETFEERMAELQARFQVTGNEAGFLRSAIALLERTMIELIIAGHEGSEMFAELEERLEKMKDRLADLNDEASDTGGPSGGAGGSGTGGGGPDRVEVQVPSDIVIHGADLDLPGVENLLERIEQEITRTGSRIVAATLFAAGPLLEGGLSDRIDNLTAAMEGAGIGTFDLSAGGGSNGSLGSSAHDMKDINVSVFLNGPALAEELAPLVIDQIQTELG